MFDLVALNAKAFVSPFVFEIQLKIVVLPTFVIPIIPHCRAIPSNYSFTGCKFIKIQAWIAIWQYK
jgi:hypothetical protein